MSTPKRIQLTRRKGWRKPAGAVVVSRPSKWGNPFRVGQPGIATNAEAVARFRSVYESADMRLIREKIVRELRGKDLACWCKVWVCDQCGHAYEDRFERETTQRCTQYWARGPANERRRCPGTIRLEPCHADVLLEIANA